MIESWKLESGATLHTIVDMHAGGEPVRILDARNLDLRGRTLLERRADFCARYDGLRRTLMLEPRGHADMYGAVLVAPPDPASVAGVVFTHASGYSTMCGHATIALGRHLQDADASGGRTRSVLECPCGPVVVDFERDGGRAGATSFENVPSFAAGLDLVVDLPEGGRVVFDLAFGGAYYAVLPAASLGVDLGSTSLADIKRRAGELVACVRALDLVRHPAGPALGFLYGAILTAGDRLDEGQVNEHVCWFGGGQIDRSPIGSGVSARLALALARGEPVQGREFAFAGRSGETFTGRVLNGDPDHVLTRISGRAFYTSCGTVMVEPSDPFARGFDPEVPFALP